MTRMLLALLLASCSPQYAQQPTATPPPPPVRPELRAFYARELCAMALPYSAAVMSLADPRVAARDLCERPDVWAPFERLYTDQLAADLLAAKREAAEAAKKPCAPEGAKGTQ